MQRIFADFSVAPMGLKCLIRPFFLPNFHPYGIKKLRNSDSMVKPLDLKM
jgi:hypothetical protein